MERFGWTPEELDEADASRLLPALAAESLMDIIQRYLAGRPLTERELERMGKALALDWRRDGD